MFIKKIFNHQNLPVQVYASFWFLICSFLQRGISFITTPIFTRLLSASEYGKYSVFNSWLTVVTVFVTLNLYAGVYAQGVIKFEDDRKVFSSSLQGLCLSLVLFWTVVYFLFQHFWNTIFSLTTTQMLAMLVIIWTSAAFSFWSVEQRAEFKCRKLVLVTLLVSIAKPLVGIFLVVNANDKVTARIVSVVVVEIIAYSWCFFSQLHRGKQFYSKKYWRYALAFNIPLLAHYLSTAVLSGADRIMIDRMVGAEAAGIYSLAYSVAFIMTVFSGALLQTLEPWLYKKIRTKELTDIPRVAYFVLVLVAAINIALIGFAPEVIALFAPIEYMDAIWIIPPVAMSTYFMFVYSFFATFEFYYEKTQYIAISTMTGAVLNIILNYVFIKMFGYYAAGYTTLFCYIVYAVCHFAFMQQVCREHLNYVKIYSVKTLLKITVCFLALGFVFLLTYSVAMLRYGIIALLVIILIVKRKAILSKISDFLVIQGESNKG